MSRKIWIQSPISDNWLTALRNQYPLYQIFYRKSHQHAKDGDVSPIGDVSLLSPIHTVRSLLQHGRHVQ
ncbi:MAG: hypothetical protein KGI46_10015, partial [Alphaproteobacteria bacterium]|nr:hypothetical protein [Alphaproteobacteria bacterium]